MIAAETPELIPLFLSHRPSLASHVETWLLPTNTQWRIYEVLVGLSLDPREWGEIIAAMFIAATNVGVRDAVERAGLFAIEGAFRWLDTTLAEEVLPSQLWREALAVPAAERLRRGDMSSGSALALCSWLVSPDTARKLLNADRTDVQLLARNKLEELPTPLRLHTAFTLVSIGLRARGLDGLPALTRGFFPVYDALASDKYFSESWQLLAPDLPQLSMWREWDRCKKLRRAIRKRFAGDNEFVAKALLEAAASPDHLAIVHQIYRDLPF